MRKLALILAVLVLGCSTYQDHLAKGQRAYQENEYEKALAIWRVLERNMDSLSPGDQARYAYLRGMTDYRLGFRADARHWLAIAKAVNDVHPGGLSGDWPQRADAALKDLNNDVFGDRIAALEMTGEAAPKGPDTAPQVEGFDAPKCASDADCKLNENCVQGACQAPPETAPAPSAAPSSDPAQ
jgi:hypothetical protein